MKYIKTFLISLCLIAASITYSASVWAEGYYADSMGPIAPGIIGVRTPLFSIKQMGSKTQGQLNHKIKVAIRDYMLPINEIKSKKVFFDIERNKYTNLDNGSHSWWLRDIPRNFQAFEFKMKLKYVKDFSELGANPFQAMLGNSPQGYFWLAINSKGRLLFSLRDSNGWNDYITSKDAIGSVKVNEESEIQFIYTRKGRAIIKIDGKMVDNQKADSKIPKQLALKGLSNRIVIRGDIELKELSLNHIQTEGSDSNEVYGTLTKEYVKKKVIHAFLNNFRKTQMITNLKIDFFYLGGKSVDEKGDYSVNYGANYIYTNEEGKNVVGGLFGTVKENQFTRKGGITMKYNL